MKKLSLLAILLLISTGLFAQEFRTVNNLKYYSGPDATEKHQLDLYLPETDSPAPLLLWIHGGAWAFGDRKNEKALAEKFAKEGIAFAAMSYRMSPGTWAVPEQTEGVRHPEHIKDVARAFQWVYENAQKYGYSSSNIFVSGYSAGGQLSALLAADKKYLKNLGLSTSNIKGIIPIAGTYDISDYHRAHYNDDPNMAEKHVRAVFGDTEADFKDASPLTYIKDFNTPIFLISESQTYDFTLLFEQALKEAKIPNTRFLHVRELDHNGLYKNLAFQESSKYRDQIIQFINELSKGGQLAQLKR